MVDAPETDAAPETDPAPEGAAAPAGPRGPRRRTARIDRRTLAISATIATIAALAAALVAVVVLRDDGGSAGAANGGMELAESSAVNTDRLFAAALTGSDGEPTTLAALVRGGPAVVNFFQSTCAPCIDEMPLFEAAAADHPDIQVIGIATEDQPDKAAALVATTKVTYPWALDPDGTVWHEARSAGMPATILLGSDGSVAASKTGAFTSAGELDRFLAKAGG